MEKARFERFILTHTELLESIRHAAHQLHSSVNQYYDGDKPYAYHLDMVAEAAREFGHEVCDQEEDILPLLMGAWFHDSIEDARFSYNDMKKEAIRLGLTPEQAFMAAEIVYALTNDKGRTRAERAGEKYFSGIRQTPYAPFCKMCDRLANTTYSAQGTDDSNRRMLKVYKDEMPAFLQAIHVEADDIRFRIPERMVDAISKL